MNVRALEIPALKIIQPQRLRDARGFFSETYSARALQHLGIDAAFVQDNHVVSLDKGVVRGLHFQVPPRPQDKLIRVTRGTILDVAVDIRNGSPTYGRHVAVLLSAENWEQLWVPKGFAHGYRTLEPNTEVLYKVTDYYAPECERGLAWDDPALGIDWQLASASPVLSEKDRGYPPLHELPAYFTYST
jgi:dTDP-4-dehydrorhamnose 3,5-epimerase